MNMENTISGTEYTMYLSRYIANSVTIGPKSIPAPTISSRRGPSPVSSAMNASGSRRYPVIALQR